jgi:predicted 3-demethylubiquinone-9 3-methyltransferase (glyoxalase superfamily)
MSKGDAQKGNAMMQALMKMRKLDIAALKAAYDAG